MISQTTHNKSFEAFYNLRRNQITNIFILDFSFMNKSSSAGKVLR